MLPKLLKTFTKQASLKTVPVHLLASFWPRRLKIKLHKLCQRLPVNFVADPRPDPIRSGPFWSDPDVRDRIWILALINDYLKLFLCVYSKSLNNKKTFFFQDYLQYFSPKKKILEEIWPKIYLGQDPDPNVFRSRIWTLSKVGSGSDQISSGFEKLLVNLTNVPVPVMF
jgi:hypothetical protein